MIVASAVLLACFAVGFLLGAVFQGARDSRWMRAAERTVALSRQRAAGEAALREALEAKLAALRAAAKLAAGETQP